MEKSEFKALKEQLFSRRRNGFDRLDGAERGALEAYCADYKAFLDAGKTERLCAAEVIRLAEEAGYRPYVRGAAVKPGDKVYLCNRGKSVLLAHIGEKSLAEGAQIAAAHIDSPRLDLKPIPTRRGWTSSPTHSMKTPSWPISRPTTTAASASTSGSPFPWSSTAW